MNQIEVRPIRDDEIDALCEAEGDKMKTMSDIISGI